MHMKRIYMIGAMLLMLMATSCHQESDSLLAYDHFDKLAFGDATNSFASKFKVTWNGLNQYYALWDFEKEQGLDWDEVYSEYLPQFEELDKRDKENPVTDKELTELLTKVLAPLHDGHFCMIWKNHITGNDVTCYPAEERNATRDDAEVSSGFVPSLTYYGNPQNGEIMTDQTGQPILMEYSTCWSDLSRAFLNTEGRGMKWIDAEMNRIATLTTPTEMEVFVLRKLKELKSELQPVLTTSGAKAAIPLYNKLVVKYSFLGIPGFDTIDPEFVNSGISVKFALLKGNSGSIAYFYFSGFNLSPYVYEGMAENSFNMSDPATKYHVQNIQYAWKSWFYYIQQQHKAGTLDGVIIDVRSNGGGMMMDGQFVAGALLPAGDFQYGYTRFKRGTGRYDYSPFMPSYMKTLDAEHEIIDDKPVVLLTNCSSVSMSEMTAQVVKLMPNGTIIGKRTHGGLCGLTTNEENTLNYAGYIGVEGQTPVFGYVPSYASFTMDKQQLESYGITPDIEVALDAKQFTTTYRDTQLERALQFVRTGK